MADAAGAALSGEEFQRLQTSLLELRSANYHLTDQAAKKDKELAALKQKILYLEEELQKSNKSKRVKGGEIIDNAESDVLRQKLATQEEEFRLQQATLIGELQRVISQQEELEQQVRELKNSKTSNEEAVSGDTCPRSALEELRADYERQLDELRKAIDSKQQTSASGDDHSQIIARSEGDLAATKRAVGLLEKEKNELIEKRNSENEQFQSKTATFQKELADLKEQLRRKQASYVSLSEEKERQLEEYKKSLDNMVQKKDAEIRAAIDEMNCCKKQVQTVMESERVSEAEKASLETGLKEAQNDIQKLSEMNERMQIQLQETISANDCLSNQLQDTRHEVERMQAQLHDSNELAEKRKALLDEMNVHLEKLKEEFQCKQKEVISNQESDVTNLKEQLTLMQQRSDEVGPLEQRVLLLESLLQTGEDRSSALEQQIAELNSSIQSSEMKRDEALESQRAELSGQIEEARTELESLKSGYESQLSSLTVERDEQLLLVQLLRQEIKDKEDGIKGVERKYQSVIKDFKRQLQNEKKRYDRLQEKMQEISAAAETGRNGSPGNNSYEEIKPTELTEGRPRGDAASVSSWTVVSGIAQKESDRHSVHTADRNSESSITMLESDNHELITRLTELQRKNFELQERVSILEETNGAMAEDLLNKASVIEQFLKEKPAAHIGAPVSPEKLPPGLKKVIDLMKIDQSAAEIRDMNKRLQLMLEETLTKNMHLQKDLEVMSEEVARLSSAMAGDEKHY